MFGDFLVPEWQSRNERSPMQGIDTFRMYQC